MRHYKIRSTTSAFLLSSLSFAFATCLQLCLPTATAVAQVTVPSTMEIPYFWEPASTTVSPTSPCYFRKRCTLINPEKAELVIASTGTYKVYVNGRLIHTGDASEQEKTYSISEHVYPGINLLAFEVERQAGSNAFSVRFRVKEKGEVRWRAMTTDSTWATHHALFDGWYRNSFREMSWLPAVSVPIVHSAPTTVAVNETAANPIKVVKVNGSGTEDLTNAADSLEGRRIIPIRNPENGESAISGTGSSAGATGRPEPSTMAADGLLAMTQGMESRATNLAGDETSKDDAGSEVVVSKALQDVRTSTQVDDGPQPAEPVTPEFKLNNEFKIDPVMSGEETGSVIAMTFDEFGHLVFSREGGHLMIADLNIPFGAPRVATLCDEIENCQGILCVNGFVFATGQGPEGLGLYLLERIDSKTTTMRVKRLLVGFTGEIGEHGPHGLTLGPDGRIYCVVGNASQPKVGLGSGPFRYPYECDMVPRYEDPGGHANGIRSPGGSIISVDLEGKSLRTVAGGIRNAYDLVFNSNGDLFVHDSDMESDVDLPWYRPTALTQVTPGADLGWRSGWSKYPYYYPDVTPPVAETGRGSPTGAICYDHVQFPVRYQGALFMADWSEGRILVVQAEPDGAGYVTHTEEFLSGRPLNVTDIEVGEDGALYFSTGGRGTSGGIYRIAWKGAVPQNVLEFKNDLTRIARHPQPNSAWARQNISTILANSNQDWKVDLEGVATESSNSDNIRIHAIAQLYLFGMFSNQAFADQLAKDPSEKVRGAIAETSARVPETANIAVQLLDDSSAYVKRKAAQGLMFSATRPPLDAAFKLLSEQDDLVLNQLGCHILEQYETATWKDRILKADDPRTFLMGSVSIMKSEANLENAYAILARCVELMNGYLSDRDFMDLLRVTQLALGRGKVDPKKVGGLTERMLAEFPTRDGMLNRELIRIIAYLNPAEIEPDLVDYLKTSEDDPQTQILIAMYLARLVEDHTDALRLAVIDTLSKTSRINAGGGFQHYLARSIREVAEAVTADGVEKIIEHGDQWPFALVPAFYKLSPEDMTRLAPKLCDLDERLKALEKSNVVHQARLGIIALLAEGKTERGDEYLRVCWESEPDRRPDIAIGLANNPTPQNWTYLVASLPILDDLTALEVLETLKEIKLRPVDPRHYRDTIELGYRIGEKGAALCIDVLKHWTAEQLKPTSTDMQSQLNAWSDWFTSRWPSEKPVTRPVKTNDPLARQFDKLLKMLETRSPQGDAERGLIVYTKAECAKCHRFGTNGDANGPDLTSLAKRFSKRETLEAIIHPSKVVADPYRSSVVVCENGVTYSGLKVDNSDGSISLIQPDAVRVRIPEDEIAESRLTRESPMPAKLIDKLSDQEVADLFAFLYQDVSVAQGTEHAVK